MEKYNINMTKFLLETYVLSDYRFIFFHIVGESDETIFEKNICPKRKINFEYDSALIGSYEPTDPNVKNTLINKFGWNEILIQNWGSIFYADPFGTLAHHYRWQSNPEVMLIKNFDWLKKVSVPVAENQEQDLVFKKTKELTIPVFSFSCELTEKTDGVRRFLSSSEEFIKIDFLKFKNGTFSF